ncbi:MAG: hypothetical protein QF437_16610 [Planctomycetota bacterium]|nr:hypothetical protein [Planctomycetota bacterium]
MDKAGADIFDKNPAHLSQAIATGSPGAFQGGELALPPCLIRRVIDPPGQFSLFFRPDFYGHLDGIARAIADNAPVVRIRFGTLCGEQDRCADAESCPGQFELAVAFAEGEDEAATKPRLLLIDGQIDERLPTPLGVCRREVLDIFHHPLDFGLGLHLEESRQFFEVPFLAGGIRQAATCPGSDALVFENSSVQKAGEPRLPSFRDFHAGMGPVEIDEAEPSLLDATVIHEQVDNICLSNSGWEGLDVKDGHLRREGRGERWEEGGGRENLRAGNAGYSGRVGNSWGGVIWSEC